MFRRRAMRASFMLLAVSILVPGILNAAETARPILSPMATLGKLVVALLLVLGAFWIFARIMRQVHGHHNNTNNALQVVGSLSLGQRERIVVVQVGDEQLVLGVTSSQINTLHLLPKPLTSSVTTDEGEFRKKLKSALNRQVASK